MNMILLAAAIAVRNPFWPIGYDGVREAISAEPTVEVQSAATAADDETATAATAARSSQTVSDRHWIDARKTLKVGGVVVVTDGDGKKHQCVMINGLAYGDGDFISVNHGNRRFTWRVRGLTEGATLKLVRVRAKMNETDDLQHKEKTK